MTKIFIKAFFIFFTILVTSSLMMEFLGTNFGSINYFNNHGYFLLFFIAIFPRLTLLLSSIPFGGLGWWLGFIFYPRILVAVLATFTYFKTNPLLVVISWMVALGGETMEKFNLGKGRIVFTRFKGPKFSYSRSVNNNDEDDSNTGTRSNTKIHSPDVIEAEFRRE